MMQVLMADVQPVYHTLSTPRGGQYGLTLPDGSRVWLNAASSIRYPTVFHEGSRRVEISGEVFLDVKNKYVFADGSSSTYEWPFVVSVQGVEIRVLGTQFNVMAYLDENLLTTTLVEGSVEISVGQKTTLLQAGQLAQIIGIKDHSGEPQILVVNNPDIQSAIAWKNGLFYFNNADVETIMRQISRWYDVDVVFEGEISTDRFSGIIRRANEASKVLMMLEMSGLRFETTERTITVLPANK
jgi:transmembrane sensor